jgi:hypothetical protein
MGSNGLWNVATFPGLTVSPNPVGVGQPVTVIMIIELLPPSIGSEASTVVTGGWVGLTLTVTNPNGTASTMGPYETTPSGDYSLTYVPTMVGTYTFQFTFPGQTVNGTGYGSYYANFLPSTSAVESLTVQQAAVVGFAEAPVPLPSQYWTQPIDAENRGWNVVSGPWLMTAVWGNTGYNATGTFNPYSYAPQSAHVLWAKTGMPCQNGLAGGATGSLSFGGEGGNLQTAEPGSIQCDFEDPIIMGGYVYYTSAPEVGNTQIAGESSAITDQAVSTESCANLQTGQVIWTVPLSTISGGATPALGGMMGTSVVGQILCWRSQQQRAVLAYLWYMGSGLYQCYDASTGALLAQWTNLPAGTYVATSVATPFGSMPSSVPISEPVTVQSGTVVYQEPNPTTSGAGIGGASGGGALLVYIYGHNPGAATGYLACWNSTLAVQSSVSNNPVQYGLQSMSFNMVPSIQSQLVTPNSFNPAQAGTPLDWEWGIMWNITIPAPPFFMSSSMFGLAPADWSILGADGNWVILRTGASSYLTNGIQYFIMAGVNVANCPETTTYTVGAGGDTMVPTTGTLAWEDNITQPVLDQTAEWSFGMGFLLNNGGNIIVPDSNTLSVTDYSESTGALLWSCTPYNNFFETQTLGNPGPVAYGMLYDAGYDGYMHAINVTNGVQEWETISRPSEFEMPEEAYPLTGAYVAGNTVFSSSTIAYEAQPAYRGHCLYAYNAQTGAQVWNVSGEYSINAIADGILIAYNQYDGREYAFEAGPSATTVTAPMTAVTAGSSCVIEGTVTDQTPGITMGTPAISDAWMGQWMEYMYMDQPYPSGATGVPVSIDAVDPNNNFVHIGNATSDITGAFSYAWTPPSVPGKYTIIATFAGSNSYYGSCGETAAVVIQAAAATPPPTYPVPYDYTMTIIATGIAIIIAVAIATIILLLRKRP